MGLAGGGAFLLVTSSPAGRVVSDPAELRSLLAGADVVALAPTMGGIHDGHLAVARRAREAADGGGRRGAVVASVYVNPLQFAPSEDFGEYPRPFAADCEKLARYADFIFAPDDKTMFPEAQQITVNPPPIASDLCGKARPHFFGGVATVVAKLFNLVAPDVAVFGKKDYQQLRVVQMMTKQMNFPVEIEAVDTVRAADGLALSSRNEYLTSEERRRAPQLFAELKSAVVKIQNGDPADPALFTRPCEDAAKNLNAEGFQVEYLQAREAKTLAPPTAMKPFVIAAAAALGKTRLIDNIESPPPNARA